MVVLDSTVTQEVNKMYNFGDMVVHPRFGLGTLDRPQYEQRELSKKLHGLRLFEFNPIVGSRLYSIFEQDLQKIRIATDNDIVRELTQEICNFKLSEDTEVTIDPEHNSVFVYNKDDEAFISLNASEIIELKKVLGEVCV